MGRERRDKGDVVKLYNSNSAPNPRRVRIFCAEKGLALATSDVDLGKLEQKTATYSSVNPFQQIPALELDDGTVITESIAICRYLEELHPEPNLFGASPLERATIDMWQRRIEFQLLAPIAFAFRHSHPAMREMENPQVPEWVIVSRAKALAAMEIFDRLLADRPFACGTRFTVADITGLVALDFTRPARITIPAHLENLVRWRQTLAARPSAAA
jgi:glutathione S-transferase